MKWIAHILPVVLIALITLLLATGQSDGDRQHKANSQPLESELPTTTKPNNTTQNAEKHPSHASADWVDVYQIALDGSKWKNDVDRITSTSGSMGSYMTARMKSGHLVLFLATGNDIEPWRNTVRVVFIDSEGGRHMANNKSVCSSGLAKATLRLFISPDKCPPEQIRKVVFEYRNSQESRREIARIGTLEKERLAELVSLEKTREARIAGWLAKGWLSKPNKGEPFIFNLIDTNGRKINSTGMKGKVVLLDFWATWCTPCVAEIPELQKLYEAYHEEGLEIIGITIKQGDKTLTDFVTKKCIPWPQVRIEGLDQHDALSAITGVSSIPRYFIIDRQGKLHTDNAPRQELGRIIVELLAKK